MFQSPLLLTGLRTPFYVSDGPACRDVPRPDDLLARMIPLLLESNGISETDRLGFLGVATSTPEAEFGQNLARHVAVLADLPHLNAMTIEQGANGFLAALHVAALRIQAGLEDMALVGAVDMPDRVPAQGYNPAPSPGLMQKMPRYFSPVSVQAEELRRRTGTTEAEETAYLTLLKKRMVGHSGTENPLSVTLWDGSDVRPQNEASGALAHRAPLAGGAVLVLLASPKWANRIGGPACLLRDIQTVSYAPPERDAQALRAVSAFLDQQGKTRDDVEAWEIFDPHVAFPVSFIKNLSLDPARVNRSGGALWHGHAGAATAGRMILDLLLTSWTDADGQAVAVVPSGKGMVGLACCSRRD